MNVSNVSISNEDLNIFSFLLQGFKAKSRITPALQYGPLRVHGGVGGVGSSILHASSVKPCFWWVIYSFESYIIVYYLIFLQRSFISLFTRHYYELIGVLLSFSSMETLNHNDFHKISTQNIKKEYQTTEKSNGACQRIAEKCVVKF